MTDHKEGRSGQSGGRSGQSGGRSGQSGGRSGHGHGRCGPDGRSRHGHDLDDHHHDHSHGHGHRRRGRHRVIDSGELQLLLMWLLGDMPRHGYDLIREIEALTGGAYAPSPGMVYPTLTLLQEMELITELESEGSRKAFTLTDQGRSEIAAKSDEGDLIVSRLTALRESHERVDGGPVRRAMENMRKVIRSRLMAPDVDKDMLHTVAGILDETAQRIERL